MLTPHDGEFTRLRQVSLVPAGSRFQETLDLAAEIGCTILRKGRCTLVGSPLDDDVAYAVDAGHSWAATPGSGDVLAGLAGARMARVAASFGENPEFVHTEVDEALNDAANIHAGAALLAADTAFGTAPAPASRIAAYIREATAILTQR